MKVPPKEEGVTYSDIAGRYPIKSAHRNQYILICYDYDRNTILTEALPFRSGACINKEVQRLLATLTTSGHKPKLQTMDNEACYLLKNNLLKKKSLTISPPCIFICQNPSEIAIQTF